MKRSWGTWLFIAGVAVTVLIAFNYSGSQKAVPLSEIFPEDAAPVDIEYEFIESGDKVAATPKAADKPIQIVRPVEVKDPIQAATSSSAQQASPAVQESAPVVSASTLSKIPYTIQVASFKERAKAEIALNEVRQKQYPAYIASKDIANQGTWYRIYVGEFQTKSEADTFLTKIQSDFKSSFVISPQ